MHQKYEAYPEQFEPADLDEAYEYVYACMKYGMEIELEMFSPELQADFIIVRMIELSRFDA